MPTKSLLNGLRSCQTLITNLMEHILKSLAKKHMIYKISLLKNTKIISQTNWGKVIG